MKLALGTAQFGLKYGVANSKGQVSQLEVKNILHLAAENSIQTLDTAIAYGNSEAVLGELGVDGWDIISKLPAVPDNCKNISQWVDDQVTASLTRLQKPMVHGLLLHRPNQLLDSYGTEYYQALQRQKDLGRVSKIGISIYQPSELDALLSVMNFDIVQAPFNILDLRLIESGWLKKLHQNGIEIHIRSVFLQGLLLMDSEQRPDIFSDWKELFSDWDDFVQKNRLSPVEACLRYVLAQPEITQVIVGVDSSQQLQEIISAAKGVLPKIPSALGTTDPILLDPSRWNQL
ncbi:aldo/keto reductase [Endozoicomonas sp. OPT23]|uniref:aldo/keto reductase n=1 Tax=Endozoicomonas sp. OPT23 TaxID=2072845 RepID=UPI00129A508E|nr:aldo/keto reductase [Endozoicomonas sp. OPT23]MRI34300.1 aldo/keto reductase [Endozoicomonas sp. OPT23]